VYSADGSDTVALEDLAIQKHASSSVIAQGATTTWTIDVETSEYTQSVTGPTLVDTVPDGLRVDATGPAASSVVEQADGSTVVTWTAGAMADLSTTGPPSSR